MLRRRGNRLAILAHIEHKAGLQSTHDDDGDVDDGLGQADFATDFDEVELNEQLQQMREDMLLDVADSTLDEAVAATAQDEELPTVEELQHLADFQNTGGDTEADNNNEVDNDSDDEHANGHNGYPSDDDDTSLPDYMRESPSLRSLADSRKTWAAVDVSKPVEHHCTSVLLSNIQMALAIWAQLNGITDRTYRGLREILQSQISADTIRDLASLPTSVQTLKASMKRRLPLIELRKAMIPLQAEKLSTARLNRRPAQVPEQELYFFNSLEYLKTLLASDVKKKMYFGLALMVDNDRQMHPWHSRAWASSARSTSGQFAHCQHDHAAIIPSDFIEFKCHNTACVSCQNSSSTNVYHQGRVSEVWRDERSNPLTAHGDIVLRIEPMIHLASFKDVLEPMGSSIKGFPREPVPHNEYVMAENEAFLISERNIISRIQSVHIDYTFGSDVEFPGEDDYSMQPHPAAILIRRKVNTKLKRFFPIVKSPPIRAELEVEEFTREAIITSLDRHDVEVISVPLILFADGFGLYRTMHKSIMGIYTGLANLVRTDRFRQMNVMPVTLGPHASNDDDVWKQVGHSLRDVENGVYVNLHGHPSFIHGHVVFLAGDFPQQQDNSGFRRPTAKQGCRMCNVTLTDRGNLNFDLTSGEHERHHHEVLRQRAFMNLQTSRGRKADVAGRFGLAIDDPALMKVLPALDIIKTRPADTAHSELGGLTKMIHLLFIDRVLTSQEYAKIIRLFPLHPGWPKIQSPHHVLQYSLTEHARWSVVAPIIVRTWLKSNRQYVKASFERAILDVFAADISSGAFGTGNVNAVDILIRILVANVLTNILLTTDKLPGSYRQQGYEDFDRQIKYSRRLFQLFCQATSDAVSSRRSMSAAPPAAAANLPTVASGIGEIASGPAAVSTAIALQTTEDIEDPRNAIESAEMTIAKSTKYKLWMSRPNVHIGLHYRDVLDEYCLPSIPMVIVFEIKHKLWKKIVYTTNHRTPEKDLFSWENIAQTIRFIILNSYSESHGELTIQLQSLNTATPSLFSSIMRGQAIAGDDNQEDSDMAMGRGQSITPHPSYVDAAVNGRIEQKECQKLGLPIKENKLDTLFRQLLTKAYARDYGRQVTIMGTGQRLRWWQSVTWSCQDKDNDIPSRTTRRRGQHIQYLNADDRHDAHGGDSPEHTQPMYGRIEQILSHAAVHGDETARVFIVVSPLVRQPCTDPYTGLDIYSTQPFTVIGLPAVLQKPVYMVPFEEDSATGNWSFISDFNTTNRIRYKLLHINWDVGFM